MRREIRTCNHCRRENKEVIAHYRVKLGSKFVKGQTVDAYLCEKHLEDLNIEQINDAEKIHPDATDLNVIIYRKRKSGGS